MNRACAGQTVLDLFPAPPLDHVEDTIRWMCDVHGCITPRQIGVFDPNVKVHTVWDRCWAATHGLPMGQVFRLRSWDYGRKRPGSWME